MSYDRHVFIQTVLVECILHAFSSRLPGPDYTYLWLEIDWSSRWNYPNPILP